MIFGRGLGAQACHQAAFFKFTPKVKVFNEVFLEMCTAGSRNVLNRTIFGTMKKVVNNTII